MIEEQWNAIGTVVGIISLIITIIGILYKFLKAWIKFGIPKKIDIIIGILSSISAIILVAFIITFVKNNIEHIKFPPKTTTITTTGTLPLTTAIESSDSNTDNSVYTTKQSYNGAVYSGYINNLRQPNGKGTMKYSDGREYTGDWVDGVQQGQGIMKYNNGIYEGEWYNGKRNGKGTYTWKDGKKYEGSYVDDVREGKGVFSGWVDLTNGYSGTYYGESKNDQFDGSGYFLFDNGDMFDGIYKENLYWTGIYTKKDGTRYNIVNGRPKN